MEGEEDELYNRMGGSLLLLLLQLCSVLCATCTSVTLIQQELAMTEEE